MSALPEVTVCCSSVSYGPFTLTAVCSLTLMFGYFLWNSASMVLIALTAGGLTQVMIFKVVDPPLPPDEPLEQATAVPATARASKPVTSLRTGMSRSLVVEPRVPSVSKDLTLIR